MLKRIVRIGFFLLVVFGQTAMAADLEVRVINAEDGQNIPAANVCLGLGANPNQFGAFIADSTGRVHFSDVPKTELLLTVSRKGFRGERLKLVASAAKRMVMVKLPRGGLGPACKEAARMQSSATGLTLRIAHFMLNGGEKQTRGPEVQLGFSVTGEATHYRVSESADFSEAPWTQLSVNPTYRLSKGNGRKMVYFQLRKSYGGSGISLARESNVAVGSIVLKTEQISN